MSTININVESKEGFKVLYLQKLELKKVNDSKREVSF